MKKISKEFWVSEETFKDLKNINRWIEGEIIVNSEPDSGNDFMNPITISWEIPEKKIEISESEFDKKLYALIIETSKVHGQPTPNEVIKAVKQKLFGKTE